MTTQAEIIGAAIADALAGHMDAQDASEAQARASQAEGQAKIADVRNEILEQYLAKRNKKGPAYTEPVVEIANTLTMQPALIPLVQRCLSSAVAEINAKVEEIVNRTCPVHDNPTDNPPT